MSLTNGFPGIEPSDIRDRAERVRLVVVNCDGVLTDGGVYYDHTGESMLRFHRRDGAGVANLRDADIDTAILTREISPILGPHAAKLGISEVRVGVSDKREAVHDMARRRGVALADVAYIGDDVYDMEAMSIVGLAACPADAHDTAMRRAHIVLHSIGGQGVLRDLADIIIEARAR